jgi:hypothetical protein
MTEYKKAKKERKIKRKEINENKITEVVNLIKPTIPGDQYFTISF